MNTLLSVVAVFAFFVAAALAGQWSQSRRRERALQVPEAQVVKLARGVPARVFVDRSAANGLKAGKINRSQADLVLTADRLFVATRHGRIVELGAGDAGSVRCTGPRRLVIEGERPGKPTPLRVRVEVILDEAEVWAAMSNQRLSGPPAALGA